MVNVLHNILYISAIVYRVVTNRPSIVGRGGGAIFLRVLVLSKEIVFYLHKISFCWKVRVYNVGGGGLKSTYEGPNTVWDTSTLVFQSCSEKLLTFVHWEDTVSTEIPMTSPVWSKWIQIWSDRLELKIPHWKIHLEKSIPHADMYQYMCMFFSVVCWYMYMSDNLLFIKVLLILKTSFKEFVMKNLLIINWVNTRHTVLEEGLIKRCVS